MIGFRQSWQVEIPLLCLYLTDRTKMMKVNGMPMILVARSQDISQENKIYIWKKTSDK